MNNNVIWLLITSLILFWPNSSGTTFVDNQFLENAQSNVKMLLNSPTKPSVAMASRSSDQSVKMQIASNNEDLAVTSLQSEVPQVVELRRTDSGSRSIQNPPSLSMKDTSQQTESREDDPEVRYALGVKILKGHGNQEKWMPNMQTKVLPEISRNAHRGHKFPGKYSFGWYYHNKKLRGYYQHRAVKRAVSFSNEAPKTVEGLSIRVKDTVEANGTDDNGGHTTTEVAHPLTQSPEDEEFVPGMSKSRFITVASTALMLGLFVAVATLYFIRRRRLRRAMDPERTSLIPFRMSTGIYYNQTGLCF